jgi:hypothetical protein
MAGARVCNAHVEQGKGGVPEKKKETRKRTKKWNRRRFS